MGRCSWLLRPYVIAASRLSPLPLDTITATLGMSHEAAQPALDALVARAVITECDGCYAFTVELMRRWVAQEWWQQIGQD